MPLFCAVLEIVILGTAITAIFEVGMGDIDNFVFNYCKARISQ